jgi:hypothetical protein
MRSLVSGVSGFPEPIVTAFVENAAQLVYFDPLRESIQQIQQLLRSSIQTLHTENGATNDAGDII